MLRPQTSLRRLQLWFTYFLQFDEASLATNADMEEDVAPVGLSVVRLLANLKWCEVNGVSTRHYLFKTWSFAVLPWAYGTTHSPPCQVFCQQQPPPGQVYCQQQRCFRGSRGWHNYALEDTRTVWLGRVHTKWWSKCVRFIGQHLLKTYTLCLTLSLLVVVSNFSRVIC